MNNERINKLVEALVVSACGYLVVNQDGDLSIHGTVGLVLLCLIGGSLSISLLLQSIADFYHSITITKIERQKQQLELEIGREKLACQGESFDNQKPKP